MGERKNSHKHSNSNNSQASSGIVEEEGEKDTLERQQMSRDSHLEMRFGKKARVGEREREREEAGKSNNGWKREKNKSAT